MSRWVRSITVLVAGSGALFGAAVATAHQPRASAAANCGVGQGKGFGYTYLTTLTVHGTSCATGRSVAKKHGKVSGWSCSKKRLATGPVQYQERETCTSGSRHVTWTYSQNT